MDIPHVAPGDPRADADHDRRRFRRALFIAAGFVAVLWWIKAIELMLDIRLAGFGVRPWDLLGLLGVISAPLLHGSVGHLVANSLPMLVLTTLAVATVPRATARALPLIWLGSGVFVWFTGSAGSTHLGASGLSHGLMLFLFLLGLLRRDRPAVATALIVFFLYGSMLLTVLPREAGISWQSHMGGALFGAIAAVVWRALDPAPARRRYSWEDEEERIEPLADEELEPPRPQDVPVLWHRPPRDDDETRGVILRFPK